MSHSWVTYGARSLEAEGSPAGRFLAGWTGIGQKVHKAFLLGLLLARPAWRIGFLCLRIGCPKEVFRSSQLSFSNHRLFLSF